MSPITRASSIIALAITCIGVGVFAQASRPAAPGDVVPVRLPLDLPAIGNIDAVTNWRFGRIESVVEAGANNDVRINIRTQDGTVLQTIGPRALAELARQSNWISDAMADRVRRPDYVERMIAFDVDSSNRIIAMISMEPVDRNRRRLQRGL